MTANRNATHKTKPNAANATMADYLKAVRGAVKPEDLRAIVVGMCRKAKRGDLDAARFLLDRFIPRELLSERLRVEMAELDAQERAKEDPTERLRRRLLAV